MSGMKPENGLLATALLPFWGGQAEAGRATMEALTPPKAGGIPAAPAPKAMPTMDDESIKAARRRAAARMVIGRTGRESTMLTTPGAAPATATLGGN